MEIKDYFYYDETSKSCLRWSTNIGKKVKRGYEAGTIDSKGYYKVNIKGKPYYAHRIIWQLLIGEIESKYSIDHKDGNRANNKINNLQAGEHAKNMRNKFKSIKNTSGATGVSFEKLANSNSLGRWRAYWQDITGKRKCKWFSVKKYGSEESFRLACEYRDKMILELNTQYAGYTERHGK